MQKDVNWKISSTSSGSSLKNRLKRHIVSSFENSRHHPHWHIDYFLTIPQVKIKSVYIIPNHKYREECNLSTFLHEISDGCIPRFGNSDCLCKSHLYYFEPNNSLLEFFFNSSYSKIENRKK